MKKWFQKILERQLQKFGFFFEHLPNNRLLKKESLVVQRHVLKRFANQLKITNNHQSYNNFLKRFVPQWDLVIEDAVFTARGLGHSNLNMHRKVTSGDKIYFEKVYFSLSQDLQNVQWFYQNAAELLETKIRVPKIEKIFQGDLLTIVYYEFLDLQPFNQKNKEQLLVGFSKDLYIISIANTPHFSDLKIVDSLKNVLDSNRYKGFKKVAEEKLRRYKIAIDRIDEAVLASKPILTHGHISKENAFREAILVDWDTVCYCPLGFDPAKIYYFLLKKNEVDDHFSNWLLRHYKMTILEEDWDYFKRNAFYFLFVFGQRKIFDNGRHLDVEQDLIGKLQKFFPESVVPDSYVKPAIQVK